METRVLLLKLSLELEFYGMVTQEIYQNSEKWLLSVTDFLEKMTFNLKCCFGHFLSLWLWCQRFRDS